MDDLTQEIALEVARGGKRDWKHIMVDWLRRQGHTASDDSRVRVGAKALQSALRGSDRDDEKLRDPELMAAADHTQRAIADLLTDGIPTQTRLSPIEKFTLLMTKEGSTQVEIASVARVSSSRISQILKSAVAKVRAQLELSDRQCAKNRLVFAYRRNQDDVAGARDRIAKSNVTHFERFKRNMEVSMTKSEHLVTNPEWIRRGLSKREADVAHLVGLGQSNKEVSIDLFITEKTVKFHMTRIMRKLGINRRAKLILIADEIAKAAQSVPAEAEVGAA